MVVCSFMALPWYVAATVISIAHIDSLKMETETSAPGEQPKFLGVRCVESEENSSTKHISIRPWVNHKKMSRFGGDRAGDD